MWDYFGIFELKKNCESWSLRGDVLGQSAANTRANAEKAAEWWCWSCTELRASEGRNKWVTGRHNKTREHLPRTASPPTPGGWEEAEDREQVQPHTPAAENQS